MTLENDLKCKAEAQMKTSCISMTESSYNMLMLGIHD